MNNIKLPVSRNCARCRKEFTVGTHNKAYCSARCRERKNDQKDSNRIKTRYRVLKMLGATAEEAKFYSKLRAYVYEDFKGKLQIRRQLG